MCTVVTSEEKYTAYQSYIAKTMKYLELTTSRPLYERYITTLEDNRVPQICCAYTKTEVSLQERKRLYIEFLFGIQLANPRHNTEY